MWPVEATPRLMECKDGGVGCRERSYQSKRLNKLVRTDIEGLFWGMGRGDEKEVMIDSE